MLTNEQIISAIDAAEAAAFGPKSSEIASDRADAIDRYNGKTYGDEKPGRSAVVSRDVSDVVEGVAANVLKPFVGGDKVVVFNPRGPEDEEAANQESDYVNFVVMERNNGFVCLASAVKDALLLRNGYLKLGWTKREDITIETYQGLSDEELALLADDKDIEIIGQREYPMFEVPQVIGMEQQPAPMLYDVKVHRKQPTEYVEIMPAPPDEILVSQRSTEPSVQNADFVQHRTHKTISELRELGYDVPDDLSDDQDNTESIEDLARNLFNAQSDQWADPTANAARRIVLFKESWLRIDKDGDGIAELRRVCSVGKNLLADEEADLIPIACFTPILMPHRHLGVSVYDLVKDIAEIKTAMLRSHLDNRYLQNNAEKVIDVNAIENIDDFLTSRPGGLKRVRGNPGAAVMPLVVPDNGAGALQTMEYLDSIRENRTGYTKAAEGMKSGSLATDTLGELNQQISQSGIRLEMIARTIAETGLRDLFRIAHALTLKHSSRAEKVRLRNVWHEVNPREWVRRTDMSISVGLGSTTGPQQMQNLTMIGQAQQQAIPLGIVTPENVYNTLSKLAIAAGFKNPDEFFTKPERKPVTDPKTGQPVLDENGQPKMESQPPPQPKDPLVQAEEVKGQVALQKTKMEQAAKPQEMAAEVEKEKQIAQIRANADIAIAAYAEDKKAETAYKIALLNANVQDQADQRTHQREQAIGMEKVKNEGRPAVQIGDGAANQALTEAAAHLKGQGETSSQMIAMLAQAIERLAHATENPPEREVVVMPNGRKRAVNVPRPMQ